MSDFQQTLFRSESELCQACGGYMQVWLMTETGESANGSNVAHCDKCDNCQTIDDIDTYREADE